MDTLSWNSSDFWGTFWGQFWIELLGGTLAAFLFLFIILWLLKPKVQIAPFICCVNPTYGRPSYYSFKFINKSFFAAHEIKVELHKLRKIPMGNGEFNNEYSKLTIVNCEISHIPGRTTALRKNKDHPHCIIIRSTEDISFILSEEMHALQLRVSLKHGLTGLLNVFEREYANTQDIKTGKFRPGTKFDLI